MSYFDWMVERGLMNEDGSIDTKIESTQNWWREQEHCLVVNQSEITDVFNKPITDQDDLITVGKTLMAMSVAECCIKKGDFDIVVDNEDDDIVTKTWCVDLPDSTTVKKTVTMISAKGCVTRGQYEVIFADGYVVLLFEQYCTSL